MRAEPGPPLEPMRSGSSSSPGGNGNANPAPQRPMWGDRLALAGHILAVIRPDDEGLRLIDVRTGSRSPLHDLNRRGRHLSSVMANPASERLLTIDYPDPARGPRPTPGSMPIGPPPKDETEVILWDLNRIEEPGVTLDKIKVEPLRRSFPPLAAFSPDGKTVAIASNKESSSVASSLGPPRWPSARIAAW